MFLGDISTLWRDFGYVVRPLWDIPPPGFEVYPVYRNVEGMSNQKWCALHGWNVSEDMVAEGTSSRAHNETTRTRVVDAVIFSIELDLLEIRINALWEQVDIFIIAESD
ncbi:hypothetical protein K7432_017707, partial [Basidiobolus ranarum]